MLLDNDLMDKWLLAGMVGLDAETSRELLDKMQEYREAEREFESTNERFQDKALKLLDKLRELDRRARRSYRRMGS